MSTATIELTSSRRRLSEALGDQHESYFAHMKSWFRKKSTKEDFDSAARKMLSADTVNLHNEFLLAILNKCQTLVNLSLPEQRTCPELLSPSKYDSPQDRLKKGKIKRKSKSTRATFDHRFQAVNVAAAAPEANENAVQPEETTVRYVAREGTLPDVGLIHGRLLVAAWDEGLEGVDNEAVKLTMVAVEQQLRTILVSLLCSRNGWREKGGVRHSVGAPLPNPWLRNVQSQLRREASNAATEATLRNEAGLGPADPPLADKAEADAMYETACAGNIGEKNKRPLSLFDLMATLQNDRSVIPSHTVYSINMERIIARLNHEET